MDVLHDGMLIVRVLQFHDGLWSGISLSLVSTFARFFVILYITVSREFVFRLSRDGHSNIHTEGIILSKNHQGLECSK
jgi:hypothetical protein